MRFAEERNQAENCLKFECELGLRIAILTSRTTTSRPASSAPPNRTGGVDREKCSCSLIPLPSFWRLQLLKWPPDWDGPPDVREIHWAIVSGAAPRSTQTCSAMAAASPPLACILAWASYLVRVCLCPCQLWMHYCSASRMWWAIVLESWALAPPCCWGSSC